MTLEAYAKARKEFRAQVLAHKKTAHGAPGRASDAAIRGRAHDPLSGSGDAARRDVYSRKQGIRDELDAYDPLVPDGSNWKATMLIEYRTSPSARRSSRCCSGIEDRVWIASGGPCAGLRNCRRRPRSRERRENVLRALSALRIDAADDSGAAR